MQEGFHRRVVYHRKWWSICAVRYRRRRGLTLVSEEGPDVKLAAAFLGAVGARTRFEKDFGHRYDNGYNQAIANAGYSPILAKGTFLSRVGRAPLGSAKNASSKAEMFDQLCQLAHHDDTLLKDRRSDLLFDQKLGFFHTDGSSHGVGEENLALARLSATASCMQREIVGRMFLSRKMVMWCVLKFRKLIWLNWCI